MIRVAGWDFREIWLVDFEFNGAPGEVVRPVCLVARELGSGRTLRLWADEFVHLPAAPYATDADSLFVAYYASAELGCHEALRWPLPENVLDLFTEFRTYTNGTQLIAGSGLLGDRITVSGIKVEVLRRDIKNLHLGVYPPNGRVRVAAPLVVNDEAVRLAVIDKLGWIRRQKAKFAEQPRQSQREMVNGESHYFLGQRYRLRIHEQDGPPRVSLRVVASLDLFVRRGTSADQREAILLRWHREQLRALIPPLLKKWQPILGVQVADWGIRKMKTKWGACSIEARRIWLNLELAKKPVQCLEYIIVHELVHLLERHHGDRFTALMDTYLPTWKALKAQLAYGPLGHEHWDH